MSRTIDHVEARPAHIRELGGVSAVPRALSEGFREKVGIPILQAWRITESSPIASVCHLKSWLDRRIAKCEALSPGGRLS